MDTRLAILSAAAFAGVVAGGALIADPGLASGLRGGSESENAQLIDRGVGQTTDPAFTTAASTTGTRAHDEHDEHDDDEDDD